MVLVAAYEGVGKSAIALAWVVKAGVPAVVVSLDTDLTTQAQRIWALKTGQSMNSIEGRLDEAGAFLAQNVKTLPMMFDYPVLAKDLESILLAATEYYGECPKFLVIDNLKNVVQGTGYEAFTEALMEIRRLTRKHPVCAIILHHMNRGGDLEYSGRQDPEFVLQLADGGTSQLGQQYLKVSVLKNRFGRADRRGEKVYAHLAVDMERMGFVG